jgi:hypothetical protein
MQYPSDFKMNTTPRQNHISLTNNHLTLTQTTKTSYKVSILDKDI